MNFDPSLLGSDGPFADRLHGFRAREQQQQMAHAVAAVIADGGVLVCEAGTGTGKTLAYLVPALVSGRRVLVSTGTRTLQDQLYERDLPLARRALGVPVRAALLKGRANYLCRQRLSQTAATGDLFARRTMRDLERVRAWAKITRGGDITEVGDVAEDSPVWRAVTSTSDNCLGQDCPHYDDCHVLKARRRAMEADLVVVNHHLFLADLALKEEGFGELLPGVDAVVVDEAHQLPETATVFFGQSLASGQLVELARDALAAHRAEAGDVPALEGTAQALEAAVSACAARLGEPRRAAWPGQPRETPARHAWDGMAAALAGLCEHLAAMAQRGRGLAGCHARALALRERLGLFAAAAEAPGTVRWIEVRRRGFVLHASPLDVGEQFAAWALGRGRAWVFTSATLAVDGRLEHFARRLGLGVCTQRVWESPFDYARQSLLYVPRGLADPGTPGYTETVAERAAPVLEASGGRAFLLFTSHGALQRAAARLPALVDFPLLVQGSAPRAELLRRFRDTPGAVLLGTSSFWEGVDVRGEALSCVVIDKLPFAPPDDPLLRARGEALRREGGDPFVTQQVPAAVIALKQGAGRLIRDESDRGVLVVCDPRLYTRRYGRVFLDSLPPMRRTRELADVRDFFSRSAPLLERA